MHEEIDRAVKTLHDERAGWVNRRDAADFLSVAACRAIAALHKVRDDKDVDVRTAVEKALAAASAALKGVTRPGSVAYTLEELVMPCAKPGRREVRKEGSDYVIEVAMKSGRKQFVHVTPYKRDDGAELVRIHTVCGKPENASLCEGALRANMKMTQGAVALEGEGDEARLIIQNYLIASEASPREVKAAVKEIAFYGDWLEQRIGEGDAY